VIARVVDKFILQLESQLADRNVTSTFPTKRAWLVEHAMMSHGARPIRG